MNEMNEVMKRREECGKNVGAIAILQRKKIKQRKYHEKWREQNKKDANPLRLSIVLSHHMHRN